MDAIQPTLLLVDNIAKVRDVFGRILAYENYRVYTAASSAEAEAILARVAIDLLIVDVRLEDDDDPQDISGALFAANYPHLARIILTAHSVVFELTRKLSGVPMVQKDEGPAVLQEAVDYAFASKVRVNWKLNLNWASVKSPKQLVLQIEPTIAGELLDGRGDEVVRLLASLFFNSLALTVHNVIGNSAERVLVSVEALNQRQQAEHYVVSIGLCVVIAAEATIYGERVGRHKMHGIPLLIATRLRHHYAANAYRLDNARPGTITPLTTFVRYAAEERVRDTVRHLFFHMATWPQASLKRNGMQLLEFLRRRVDPHKQGKRVLADQLTTWYAHAIASNALHVRESDGKFALTMGDDHCECSHPLHWLFERNLDTRDCSWGTISRSLDLENILCDQRSAVWLQEARDFDEGPLFWHHVRLETATCFELARNASSTEFIALMQSLFPAGDDVASLTMPLHNAGDLSRLVTIVDDIRHLALEEVEWTAYLHGLLACSLEYLYTYAPMAIPVDATDLALLRHAFVRTLFITKYLEREIGGVLPQQDSDTSGLVVDFDARQVLVNNHIVVVSDHEYRLLSYLYSRIGVLCLYKDLFTAVWGDPGTLKDTRLTTLINRLRPKLRARSGLNFIRNHKSRGYELVPQGIDVFDE